MVADSTIFWLQFTAAVFMGTDYFLKETQHKRISLEIQKLLLPVDEKASQVISENLRFAVQQKISLMVGVGFLLGAWGGTQVLSLVLDMYAHPWIFWTLFVVWVFLVIGGAKKFAEVLFPTAMILASRAAIRLVAKFLIHCPKGSVFGIGYLFLMASFACRYLNLPT